MKKVKIFLALRDWLKDESLELSDLVEHRHKEGLKTNIEELKLKIKTLENEMPEGWGENVLDIQQRILGEEHPDTATSLNNVGGTYSELGDYQKALECHEKALDIRMRIFGEEHPDTATSFNNVGCAYIEIGEYAKALEKIGKAYSISKDNGRTESEAIYLNRLGRVHTLMGDKETAIKEFQEAISLLPQDHPEAIDSKERLGAL